MGEQNFPDNVLYELDNLNVLRGMNDETVDLIATDPPFNTQRNRSGTAGFYVDKWKWGDTGVLPDQWAWNEVHPVWLEQIKDDNPALYEVIDATRVCHDEDIAAFPLLPERPPSGDAPRPQAHGQHLPPLRPRGERLHPHGDGRRVLVRQELQERDCVGVLERT